MNGERNLTRPVLLRVAEAMELDRPRTEYFEDLVSFNQAKTQTEKEFYFGKIMAIRQSVQVKSLEDRQYEFFSEWYHSVIRELVTILPKGSSTASMAKRVVPGVSASQVKRSLELMLELGILKKKPGGSYVQSDPFIGGATQSITDLGITRFQKSMLQVASQSWENFSEKEVKTSTVTFTMSDALAPVIAQEIKAFRARLLHLIQHDDKPANRVYHLNVQLFPVSRKTGEEHS